MPQLWDARSGEPYTIEEAACRLLTGCNAGDRGVSFVGGEPFAQPDALAALCAGVRQEWPATPGIPIIILYSGYTLEALLAHKNQATLAALKLADVLIDGPFVAAQADDKLAYRGSRNQRVIDLPATLAAGQITTLDWDRPRITLVEGRIVMPPSLARKLGLPDNSARHCGQLAD